MFFRDYKSKIVKGIDEDDLLEGNPKNTESNVTCVMDDTLINCQCGLFHHSEIYVFLLNNVAQKLSKQLFSWQLNLVIFYLHGFIVICYVSSFNHMACFLSECHETEKIMLIQNIIDLSKQSFSVVGIGSQNCYYRSLKFTYGFFLIYYRKYLICSMM